MDLKSERRQFASDNWAGMCPEAIDFMMKANEGHVPSYGEDKWTQRASDLMRRIFETDCEVFFVFNGTAANSLALASLCNSYHSIICGRHAHVETDECGAPEFFSNGTKLLLATGENGKLLPWAVEDTVKYRTDIHYPKPRVLSVTQATELGTVYSVKELKALQKAADRHRLRIHMDGARFANAVVTLGARPRELSAEAGVDVLCFGGSKIGGPPGEAVVFFNKELAYEFDYRCKQAGQLSSKMRFIAAPWVGILESGAWLKHAGHANGMAKLLEAGIKDVSQVRILYPVEANSVFLQLPDPVSTGLQSRGWFFHNFAGNAGARFMCSWDTTESDVDALAKDIRELASRL